MDRTTDNPTGRCVALSGGVGGAKLVLGLQAELGSALTAIANTGDDFEHLGLPICPDIDTLLYTLGGVANAATGWGRADESWSFMAAVEALGGPTWFRLGDRDLATHALRQQYLAEGQSLTAVTDTLRQRLGIAARVLPMSDAPVRTRVQTAAGELEFQDYFVRQQARPVATGLRYAGAESARATAEVGQALTDPDLQVIVVTPSNPWLSIAPILSLPGLRATIESTSVPVVGVSPIIAGKAVKGPAAKLMRELGLTPSATAIAGFYGDLLDGFVIDSEDAAEQSAIEARGMAVTVTNTRMQSLNDKARLAAAVLAFADELRSTRAPRQ